MSCLSPCGVTGDRGGGGGTGLSAFLLLLLLLLLYSRCDDDVLRRCLLQCSLCPIFVFVVFCLFFFPVRRQRGIGIASPKRLACTTYEYSASPGCREGGGGGSLASVGWAGCVLWRKKGISSESSKTFERRHDGVGFLSSRERRRRRPLTYLHLVLACEYSGETVVVLYGVRV